MDIHGLCGRPNGINLQLGNGVYHQLMVLLGQCIIWFITLHRSIAFFKITSMNRMIIVDWHKPTVLRSFKLLLQFEVFPCPTGSLAKNYLPGNKVGSYGSKFCTEPGLFGGSIVPQFQSISICSRDYRLP